MAGVGTERQDELAQLSDEDLLGRVADRDAIAGRELFDRYSGEIYRFLFARLGEQDSEDLLQEVFTRALRGACRFRGDASVRTWLRAIARYTLYERLRAPFVLATLPDLAEQGSGPESLAIRREALAARLDQLERLPPEQAAVLELHRVEGLTHAQIADRLGIKAATSRKRLERAIQALDRLVPRDPGKYTPGADVGPAD